MSCFGLSFPVQCEKLMSVGADAHLPDYLSLGTALSTLTLVLTFLQLTKPEHRFRARVRKIQRWFGFFSLMATFACACGAAGLQAFKEATPTRLWEHWVFWQWLGILLEVLGIAAIAYSNLIPVKISRFNSRSFARACREVLNTNQAEARERLAAELYDSMGYLVMFSAHPHQVRRKMAALEIFQSLSVDEDFCQLLVEKQTDVINRFIDNLKKHQPKESSVAKFFQALLGAAWLSKDSFLYKEYLQHKSDVERHEENDAKSYYEPDTAMYRIFDNQIFIELYKPFYGWRATDPRFHEQNSLSLYWECFAFAFHRWHASGNPAFNLGSYNIARTLIGLLKRHGAASGAQKDELNPAITQVSRWYERFGGLFAKYAKDYPEPGEIVAANYDWDTEGNSIYGAAARLLVSVARLRRFGPPLHYPNSIWRFVSQHSDNARYQAILVRSRALLVNAMTTELAVFIRGTNSFDGIALMDINLPKRGQNAYLDKNSPTVGMIHALCLVTSPWPPFDTQFEKWVSSSGQHPIVEDVVTLFRTQFFRLLEIDSKRALQLLPDYIKFRESHLEIYPVDRDGDEQRGTLPLISSDQPLGKFREMFIFKNASFSRLLDDSGRVKILKGKATAEKDRPS